MQTEIKNENNKERRLKMLMNFKLKVHNEYMAEVKSAVHAQSLAFSSLICPVVDALYSQK